MRALMSSSLPDADDAVPEREGMKAFFVGIYKEIWYGKGRCRRETLQN
jgi:hypothetical protein